MIIYVNIYIYDYICEYIYTDMIVIHVVYYRVWCYVLGTGYIMRGHMGQS